jgi:hypothetical protein
MDESVCISISVSKGIDNDPEAEGKGEEDGEDRTTSLPRNQIAEENTLTKKSSLPLHDCTPSSTDICQGQDEGQCQEPEWNPLQSSQDGGGGDLDGSGRVGGDVSPTSKFKSIRTSFNSWLELRSKTLQLRGISTQPLSCACACAWACTCGWACGSRRRLRGQRGRRQRRQEEQSDQDECDLADSIQGSLAVNDTCSNEASCRALPALPMSQDRSTTQRRSHSIQQQPLSERRPRNPSMESHSSNDNPRNLNTPEVSRICVQKDLSEQHSKLNHTAGIDFSSSIEKVKQVSECAWNAYCYKLSSVKSIAAS